ncbi:MAG TPA: hypothetical protein VH592_09265 [Gemmataceae bacterium]|jgi:DNA-directed RNA polymerase subunit M/transcription elongation factor TFIIS
MATARLTCPDCKSALKPAKPVPDGKKIKCPKCGNVFTSPGLVAEEEERIQKAPAKVAPQKKKAAAAKPPPKKADDDDDDDDGGGIYSFVGADEPKKENEEEEEESKPYIEYAPDMSIKDLRGPAQEKVVKPSNLIMLICGLSVLSNLFLICWSFWPMVFSESVVDWYKVLAARYKEDRNAMQRIQGYKEFKDLDKKDREIVEEANEEAKFSTSGLFPWLGRVWLMGVFLLMLIYEAVTIIGAVKMQNLESRRWGIASAIMMLFPPAASGLSSLFALGFHFLEDMTGFLGDVTNFYMIVAAAAPYLASIYIGAISLQTLLNQKVIDGFEYVAD